MRRTRRVLEVLGGLMRLGFAEALAYRAELLLWVLATTMPLVMMALFAAVTREGPMGRFGRAEIVTYFMMTLLVRQLTSSWAAWQLSRDIRQGVLSMRLLLPVHPLLSYAVESLTAIPLRMVVAAPVVVICAFVVDPRTLSHAPLALLLASLALAQGWLLSVAINLAVGCVSFFFESGVKLMDFVLVAFMLASGYLMPLELLPEPARRVVDVLPFRYQLALPVELLTGRYDADLARALRLCAAQAVWVVILFGVVSALWRRGVRRFEAFGG